MSETVAPESYEALYRFHQRLDSVLEEQQDAGVDLGGMLRVLESELTRATGARAAAMRLAGDDGGPDRVFRFGGEDPAFAARPVDLDPGWHTLGPGVRAFAADFDIKDEVLGSVTLYFEDPPRLAELWVDRYTEAFAELLDNLLYQLRQEARQHRLGLEVQACLETPVFEAGLDRAMLLFCDELPIAQALFLYTDEHLLYPTKIAYRAYRGDGALAAESIDLKDPQLEAALADRQLDAFEARSLPDWLCDAGDAPLVVPLTLQGSHPRTLGKLFLWLEPDAPVAATLKQAELLRSPIVQRLADYSKDARNLEKFFPPQTVIRLLRTPDYGPRYLAPRVETLGVLFTDVSGFTALSETVFQGPADVGRFFNLWSEGATRILLHHQGVVDKLIGDCLMGLYGPPFFRAEGPEAAYQLVTAALEIRRFTQGLLDHEWLAGFKDQILARGGLTVTAGVNITPAAVGIFGPNEDFTAFSSGINNAARLQSLAKPGQVLVLQHVAEALMRHPESRRFKLGTTGATKAKNVAEPLPWVEILES